MGMNSYPAAAANRFRQLPLWQRAIVTGGAGVVLVGALGACSNAAGNSSSATPTEASASAFPGETTTAAVPTLAAPSPSKICTPANVAVHAPNGTFTFDMRCGGSNIIQVYPGTGDSEYDKTSDGTFADRQTAKAICQTTGRMVLTHPEVGEVGSPSAIWTEIEAGGKKYFATDAYGEATGTLPQCPVNELPPQ